MNNTAIHLVVTPCIFCLFELLIHPCLRLSVSPLRSKTASNDTDNARHQLSIVDCHCALRSTRSVMSRYQVTKLMLGQRSAGDKDSSKRVTHIIQYLTAYWTLPRYTPAEAHKHEASANHVSRWQQIRYPPNTLLSLSLLHPLASTHFHPQSP